MRNPRAKQSEPLPMLAPLPGWITATPPEGPEEAAFKSGAALAHLTPETAADHVLQALWRDRLALAAAEVSARISGRREGAAAMRDALHLTKPGDDPGPAGSILRQWSRAVSRPISVTNLSRTHLSSDVGVNTLTAQPATSFGLLPSAALSRADLKLAIHLIV